MDNLTVLVVTNEKKMTTCIEDVCNNPNVTILNSSIMAYELIRKQRFDIYIIDFDLPVISGIELLEEIKDSRTDKGCICILSLPADTAYIFKEEFKNGLFHFVLEKPVSTHSVKKIMKNALIRINKLKPNTLQKNYK